MTKRYCAGCETIQTASECEKCTKEYGVPYETNQCRVIEPVSFERLNYKTYSGALLITDFLVWMADISSPEESREGILARRFGGSCPNSIEAITMSGALQKMPDVNWFGLRIGQRTAQRRIWVLPASRLLRTPNPPTVFFHHPIRVFAIPMIQDDLRPGMKNATQIDQRILGSLRVRQNPRYF